MIPTYQSNILKIDLRDLQLDYCDVSKFSALQILLLSDNHLRVVNGIERLKKCVCVCVCMCVCVCVYVVALCMCVCVHYNI